MFIKFKNINTKNIINKKYFYQKHKNIFFDLYFLLKYYKKSKNFFLKNNFFIRDQND